MSSTGDLRLLRYWARLPLLHKVLTVVALPTFALLVTMMSVVLADQQHNSANEWVKHTLIVRAQIDRTQLLATETYTLANQYALARRAPVRYSAERRGSAQWSKMFHRKCGLRLASGAGIRV